jgi:hypothetical protein
MDVKQGVLDSLLKAISLYNISFSGSAGLGVSMLIGDYLKRPSVGIGLMHG